MIKERINLKWILILCLGSFIFSIVGISLPDTINLINGLDKGSFYGHLSSYGGSMLLFYALMSKVKISVKRESYIKLLKKALTK